MNKILQHVLPPNFHRTRAYGLHAPSTRKRLALKLERFVKAAPDMVTMLFRLLKAFLKSQLVPSCEQCGSHTPPKVTTVAPDHHFIGQWLGGSQRAPPGRPTAQNPQPVAA
jgi:hypothetical protein